MRSLTSLTPDNIYYIFSQVERDAKTGHLSQSLATQQKVEILTALRKLGGALVPNEEAFLMAHSSASLRAFDEVSADIGE